MISDQEKEALRGQLESERSDLHAQLAAGEEGEDSKALISESGEDADPGDVGDKIEELVNNVPVKEALEKRLQDVENALQKFDAGTYGICEISGEEIPLERLQANPAARATVEHAQ